MKFSLLLILILSSIFGITQNYQTFKSSDIRYFRENNEGLILASQIDSTNFFEGDSIFYPFTSLRPDPTFTYSFIKAPGWMGEKIIVQNDGINLFFNRTSDTITIDTRANAGDSFTLYKFESGNTITATVTSIIEEPVLDVLDSVKTYMLTSDEPGFDLASPSIRIGKNSGLIDLYPFYSFPQKYNPLIGPGGVSEKYVLVGQLYPRMGITKPTFFDVNNVNEGDVIQTKYTYGWIIDTTARYTILSKELLDPLAVKYEIEKYAHYHYGGTSDEDPAYDSIYTTYFIDTLSISEDFAREPLIPEKNYGEGITDDTFWLTYDPICGYAETRFKVNSVRVEEAEIESYYVFESLRTQSSIYNGSIASSSAIGYYDFNYTIGIDPEFAYWYSNVLESKKQDDLICGEGTFLNIESSKKKTNILIYPNPSSGSFNIEIDGVFDLSLFSGDGRLVYSKNKQTSQDIIDVDLPNGIYFLLVNQNGTTYNHKVVIDQ